MATSKLEYATGTKVEIGKTRQEITDELERLGASLIAPVEDKARSRVVLAFEREGVRYQIVLPLPDSEEIRFWSGRANKATLNRLSDEALAKYRWQQECAACWRRLLDIVRSIRVGVEAGIVKTEVVLLPYVVLGNGQTVAEHILPQLPASLEAAPLLPMLPGLEAPRPPTARVMALPAPQPPEPEEDEGE